MAAPRNLFLASTSPYRRTLLERLSYPFGTLDPAVDETPASGETARELVERLSVDKARAGAAQVDSGLVIGSDQVLWQDGEIIGKPGDREKARSQLHRASGRTGVFLSGLALMDVESGRLQVDTVRTEVWFRSLTECQIDNYLARDEPYDCAGSLRCESLGTALLARQRSDDPSALIGLPLIRLVQMLAVAGVDVLQG